MKWTERRDMIGAQVNRIALEREVDELLADMLRLGADGRCEVCGEWLDDRGNCPVAHEHE